MSERPAIDPTVLDAGRKAIRQYGWNHTTAERIADAAGVSRVTLHRRGIKREHVLAALVEVAIDFYREAMWPVLVDTAPAAQRLATALEVLCDTAEGNLEVLTALQAAAGAVFHDPDETRAGEGIDTRAPFVEPFERILADGATDGTLRAVEDPHETATVLFNAVGWTYVHLRDGHHWPPQRARATAIALVLHGLLP